MADKNEQQSGSQPFNIPTSANEIVKVLLTGIVVGLLIALISEAIARYLISPLFCNSTDNFSVCANGGNVAFYAATVIVNMIAVAALVRFGVFRPLLVALGAAAILWGLKSYLSGVMFVEYAFWMALLYGLTYTLLFWVLRVRNFIIALVLVIALVIIGRLVLVA